MEARFDLRHDRRRAPAETVISMIKRRQGPHVRGRFYHSLCGDLRLLVTTRNVMVSVFVEVF
jgi:hypothetical protein